MVDALLFRPLQIKDSARVVEVWEEASWLGFPQNTPAPANMLDWKRRNHVFTDMAATRGDLRALTGDGQPQQVEVTFMTANLLPLLGVAPALGRGFSAQEDQQADRAWSCSVTVSGRSDTAAIVMRSGGTFSLTE
jgi:putative ABC transport system permease protein